VPAPDLRCPLCRLPAQADGSCPDCGQDLAPLAHLQARPALRYNRALGLVAAGDDEAAQWQLEAALAEDEDLVDAWVVLGKLRARDGRADAARAALDQARARDPEHQGARTALAALDARQEAAAVDDRARHRRRLALAVLGALTLVTVLVVALLPGRPAPAPPVPAAGTTVPGVTVEDQLRVEPTAPDPTARLAAAVAAVQMAAPVLFPAGQVTLDPRGLTTVQAIAGLLTDAGEVTIQVDGHAAPTPGDGAQAVSDQRAGSVRDALIAAGVDATKITTRGLADTRPRETLDSSRRVEIMVIPA
jgi:outer membrane protein OmpA-like peptidoglycan-associated protein